MIDSKTIAQAFDAAASPQLVERGEQLLDAAGTWHQRPVLGIDTEFLRERTYRAQLGLVQVSDGRKAWLVDMIRLRDSDPLRRLFSNPDIVKVFHSASEDLEVLWHALGVAPGPMVDTQIACALLGQPLQMSYQHAVKWLTGVEVDKELTRSDWIRRPLKPEQIHYAATDVVFLPAMFKQLQVGLLERGRWPWLQEDVGRMIDTSQREVEPGQAYLRVRGSGQLDPVSLRLLKALAEWREQTALDRNLARGFVISDRALLQLAQKKPSSAVDLSELDGIHPKALRRHQSDLLRIVRQNRNSQDPVTQLPPLDNQQRRMIKKMRDVVRTEAQRLQIDPAMLASKKLLEALLRAHQTGDPVPDRLCGWRGTVITEKLLRLLDG